MGEIGAMVARLEQEGLDLNRLIDDELEEVGFLALCSRSTASLSSRADVISGSQNELKTLLKSIEDQLRKIQKDENLPLSALEHGVNDDKGVKHIIVIDDEEETPKNDFSCQTNMETETPPVTIAKTSTSESICVKNVASESVSTTSISSTATTQTKPAKVWKVGTPVSMLPKPIATVPEATPKNLVTEEGVIAYRTLKSPTESGAATVTSMVTLKSSKPTIPPQHLRSAATPSMPSASAETSIPDTRSSSSKQKDTPGDMPVITPESKRPPSPPRFEEGTRIIGKRADDLWYPGEILKVIKDRFNQVKFRVKFDQGNRGLLRSNHIALESSPPLDVLHVGSRVVALRPRETADEAASWREAKEGPYGKLDVLYAGIVAEICCPQNSNRFLIFFDDGFAQYLPLHKLHHVYHTGDKVWNEVAEHSQEFIQEYLEEFPNRPMVVLKTNQWVKTEWRGKWLKAKVMQVDCSLVKMLFQVDNRSEWIYRGSTRLEPLYKALVDGKISKSKKNKRQRKAPQNSDEPYVDMSLTSPHFGFCLYSKTDPKGKKQEESEKNRNHSVKQVQQGSEGSIHTSSGGQDSSQNSSKVEQNTSSRESETTSKASGRSTNNNTSSTTDTRQSSLHTHKHTVGTNTLNTTPLSNTTTHKSIATNTTRTTTPRNILPNNQGIQMTTGKIDILPNNQGVPKTAGKIDILPNNQGVPMTAGKRNIQPNNQGIQMTTGKIDILPNNQGVPMTAGKRNIQPNNQGVPKSVNLTKTNNSCSIPDSTVGMGWTNSPITNHILDESTVSIIQASTIRKRTTAGLITKTNFNHVGTNVVTFGADSTNIITSNMVNNGAVSVMSPVRNKLKWEAPWKQRQINSDSNIIKGSLQKPVLSNSIHDAAALIQERLQAEKKLLHVLNPLPEIKPLIPKPAVLGPHKCGKHCGQTKQVDIKEKSKHNMMSLPLMLNWKREITKRHPRSKKEIYYRAPCNKRLRSIADVGKYLTLTGTSNVTIDQFCFDPEISCANRPISTKNILSPDISNGAETVSISVVNEHDSSYPPPIDYVSDRILSEGVNIVTDPGFLACCDCTDNCQDKSKCSCAQLTISASAAVDGKEDIAAGYEYRKLMDCVPTGIYECNQNCACASQCFNRMVQNGIRLRLQVFKTENRGWGLRTLDDIPVGTFICTYSGQVMNEDMANKEGRDFGDEYLAELDHIEVVEKIKEGYESSVSDIEDDSVILKTLDDGSSECSDNGFMSDSDMSSDTDSVISENSSLYEPVYCDTVTPKIKSRKKEAKKQSAVNTSPSTNGAVIIKEDGKMFRVTMADEKYVVASSSNTGSIVLRRISVPSEDTTDNPNHESKDHSNVSPCQEPCGDPPPMPCEPTVIDLTSSDEDESIGFPVETNNKQSTDDGGVGDVKNMSKASSSLGDHFDLCLDISTESTESCDMDQGHVTDTADSSQDDYQLSDSEKNSNIDGSASKEELRHVSCHDNSESTKDSDNMDLIDKTRDGSHKEGTSTDSDNMDLVDKTCDGSYKEGTSTDSDNMDLVDKTRDGSHKEGTSTDSDNMDLVDKTCDGSHKEGTSTDSDNMDLIDKTCDGHHKEGTSTDSDNMDLIDKTYDGRHKEGTSTDSDNMDLVDKTCDGRHKEGTSTDSDNMDLIDKTCDGRHKEGTSTDSDNMDLIDKTCDGHHKEGTSTDSDNMDLIDKTCDGRHKEGTSTDSDNMDLIDKTCDGHHKEGTSTDSDNMDLIDKTCDGHHKEGTSTDSTKNIEIAPNHKPSSDVVLDNTKEIPDINTDGNRIKETLTKVDSDVNHDKPLEIPEDKDFKVNSGDYGSHGNSNHDNDKVSGTLSEHSDEGKDLDSNHDNSKGEVANDKEVANSDQKLNMDIDEEKDQPSSSASSDDNVPPLMSADDLSKLAAQLHQPDEEPPTLTKMECGIRLTDLKDTITKLQSRGVALDGVSPETVQDSTPSFEDLPLFPESSTCDVESFPPSPASTDSDSSVTDSIDKSSDASFDRNVRVKSNSSGRRARRFIVTLQKNGIKRSASPGMTGDSPVKKATTRSLFDEEHCYVIDAKAYGNCGRYLNHSCSPNLFVQNVFIDTHDLRFPRVAFFAQHNISAGSELTWDYMYEVGSVQDKVLRCYCGSSQCRGRLL